ncbi:MAG: hypothetical protein ABJ013_08290 [Halioglobus sp.]
MDSDDRVQLEISQQVLHRLFRERKLVASEVKALNGNSRKAAWQALKCSLCAD